MINLEIPFDINCTGDCCKGDIVKFERAVFDGSYPKVKFSHNEEIIGEIIKESYGKEKQQHTFTIETILGEKIRIKGRNLYRHGVYRQLWENEEERKVVIEEKHQRGRISRIEKSNRISNL